MPRRGSGGVAGGEEGAIITRCGDAMADGVLVEGSGE